MDFEEKLFLQVGQVSFELMGVGFVRDRFGGRRRILRGRLISRFRFGLAWAFGGSVGFWRTDVVVLGDVVVLLVTG